METRYRTVIPIVGIVLVLIVALVAFFITRRVRNATSSPSPTSVTANANLILPTFSPTPRPTIGTIRVVPDTGPENQAAIYTTSIDNAGFRETAASVITNTDVIWINLGSVSQTISVAGLSHTLAPNAKYAYAFTKAGTYTVTIASSSQAQTITVK